MSEYIEIESTFDGSVSFVCYGCLDNDKHTPYIAVRCIDAESGKAAEAKMWCSEKALEYTVKKLKALGVEGETDRDIIAGAADLDEVPCTFDTIDKDGYVNADNVRAKGTTAGGRKTVAKDDFLASVFGEATTPTAKTETAEAPAPF